MSSRQVVAQAELRRHAVSDCTFVHAIDVTAQRASTEVLRLSYRLSGELSMLRIPATTSVARRDGLWQHTCAELFVVDPQRAAYCEFNFAPSTEWAAYEFSGYRQGMRPIESAAPIIVCQVSAQELLLQVEVNVPALAGLKRLQLGLSMVIEDTLGQLSYWALQHPGERPDFHHRDSFVLEL